MRDSLPWVLQTHCKAAVKLASIVGKEIILCPGGGRKKSLFHFSVHTSELPISKEIWIE